MNPQSTPNPEDFSADDRAGIFMVTVEFSGIYRTEVEADSEDDARRKIAAEIETDGIDALPDSITDTEVRSVRPHPTMYRVTRDGRPMQVSKLLAGDTPRQPDERGF